MIMENKYLVQVGVCPEIDFTNIINGEMDEQGFVNFEQAIALANGDVETAKKIGFTSVSNATKHAAKRIAAAIAIATAFKALGAHGYYGGVLERAAYAYGNQLVKQLLN